MSMNAEDYNTIIRAYELGIPEVTPVDGTSEATYALFNAILERMGEISTRIDYLEEKVDNLKIELSDMRSREE